MGESNTGWAVVVANAGQEEIADRNISARGYEVDFLWYRKLLVEKRRVVDGRRQRMARENLIVRRPLFRGYGFVLVEHGVDASDIDAAIGVSRLLRHAPQDHQRVGRPRIVRASIAESFRAAAAAGEFDDTALRPKPELRTDLTIGATVRQPATGFVATVLNFPEDDGGRVHYFINLLGGAKGWFSREEAAELELVEA